MAALVDSSSAMLAANTAENRMSEYTDINFAMGLWSFEDIEEDLAAQLLWMS